MKSSLYSLITVRKDAAQYAADVVRNMIRIGCDPNTMRQHEIPTSVFYGVLGSLRQYSGQLSDVVAGEMIELYRHDYLYADNQTPEQIA